MFDLDRGVAEWRRQMTTGGVKTAGVLDELESHLRADFEQLLRSGKTPEQAFDLAVQRIGPCDVLKKEFRQACRGFEMRPAKLAGIACGVGAGVFSLWILGNLLTIHEATLAARFLGLAAILLVLLAWRYAHQFLPVIPNRHVRTAVGLVCCLASVVLMALYVKLILPRFLEPPVGSEIVPGQVMVSFLWAWAAVAILGSLAFGLEKSARRLPSISTS